MTHQDVVIALWAYGIFGHRPTLTGPAAAAAAASLPPAAAAEASSSSHGGDSWGDWGGGQGEASRPSQHLHSDEAPSPSPSSSSERASSSLGASSSSPSSSPSPPGILVFAVAMISVVRPRLRHLQPKGIANVIKALGSLRVAGLPEAQTLARDAARLSEARMAEFRPDEMSNLLYGLSLMRINELPVYHAAVLQCRQLMEGEPNTLRWLNHKVSRRPLCTFKCECSALVPPLPQQTPVLGPALFCLHLAWLSPAPHGTSHTNSIIRVLSPLSSPLALSPLTFPLTLAPLPTQCRSSTASSPRA